MTSNYFLFFLLIPLHYSAPFIDLVKSQCKCAQMRTRDDCIRYGCKLVPQKIDKKQKLELNFNTFKNKTQLTLYSTNFKCTNLFCKDITDEDFCDNTGECAWTGTACDFFSQCGNYVVNDPEKCLLKSTDTRFCIAPNEKDQGANTYTCKPDLSKAGGNYMTCFSLPTKEVCESYEDAICIWREVSECDGEGQPINNCLTTGYCLGLVLENCRDLNNRMDLCQREQAQEFCVWEDNSKLCREKECADLSQNECRNIVSIVSDKVKKGKYCEWNQTSCVENFNHTLQDMGTCLYNSMNISSWDPNVGQCRPCWQEVQGVAYLLILMLFFYI